LGDKYIDGRQFARVLCPGGTPENVPERAPMFSPDAP
jgi:hypothetical protein